jgi:hypothetical protein
MSDMLLDKLDKGLDEIIRQKKKTAPKKRKSTGAKKPAGGRTPKAKTGVGRRRRHPDSCVAADLRRALSRIESTDRRVNELSLQVEQLRVQPDVRIGINRRQVRAAQAALHEHEQRFERLEEVLDRDATAGCRDVDAVAGMGSAVARLCGMDFPEPAVRFAPDSAGEEVVDEEERLLSSLSAERMSEEPCVRSEPSAESEAPSATSRRTHRGGRNARRSRARRELHDAMASGDPQRFEAAKVHAIELDVYRGEACVASGRSGHQGGRRPAAETAAQRARRAASGRERRR